MTHGFQMNELCGGCVPMRCTWYCGWTCTGTPALLVDQQQQQLGKGGGVQSQVLNMAGLTCQKYQRWCRAARLGQRQSTNDGH